jgi:hypothetical protein
MRAIAAAVPKGLLELQMTHVAPVFVFAKIICWMRTAALCAAQRSDILGLS